MTIAKIWLDSQVMLRAEMERMGLSYQELQEQDQILTCNGILRLKTKYTHVLGENVRQDEESQKYFLMSEYGLPLEELTCFEVCRKTDLDNSLYGQLDSEQYVNLDVFWPMWKKPFQVDRVLPVSLYKPQPQPQPQQEVSAEVKFSAHGEVLQFIVRDGKELRQVCNKLAGISKVVFLQNGSGELVDKYIKDGWKVLSSAENADQTYPDYILWR